MENNKVLEKDLKSLIYEIRGKQVMLDSHLAMLFNYETKYLNRAVKRNIGKFRENCYFQLTDEEKNYLWFQFGTANNMSRTNPYVFTEDGIVILSTIIKSEVVRNMSRIIIVVFREKNSNLLLLKNAENTGNIRNLIYEVKGKQVMTDYDFSKTL